MREMLLGGLNKPLVNCHSWNTLYTGDVCPACLRQWAETLCLGCSRWSPHSDWCADSIGGECFLEQARQIPFDTG